MGGGGFYSGGAYTNFSSLHVFVCVCTPVVRCEYNQENKHKEINNSESGTVFPQIEGPRIDAAASASCV